MRALKNPEPISLAPQGRLTDCAWPSVAQTKALLRSSALGGLRIPQVAYLANFRVFRSVVKMAPVSQATCIRMIGWRFGCAEKARGLENENAETDRRAGPGRPGSHDFMPFC